MPKESLNCPTCGGGDLTEFKADTYICAYCEVPFKWTPPPEPAPVVVQQTIVAESVTVSAERCAPCKQLGVLKDPAYVCKFCQDPCCANCMYHFPSLKPQSLEVDEGRWHNVPTSDQKAKLFAELQSLVKETYRLGDQRVATPLACKKCADSRYEAVLAPLRRLLPRCGQCHKDIPASTKGVHDSNPFDCPICGTKVCKQGRCRYFRDHGLKCYSCGMEHCQNHLVRARVFQKGLEDRTGSFWSWTAHLGKRVSTAAWYVICHTCVAKARYKRLLNDKKRSASGRAAAVAFNRAQQAKGKDFKPRAWIGHGLKIEFLVKRTKYQADAADIAKNDKLIEKFESSEKRLNGVGPKVARLVVSGLSMVNSCGPLGWVGFLVVCWLLGGYLLDQIRH